MNSNDADAQLITAILEEDIVFGRLAPQQRLIEENLSQRFTTKRHIVRQALAELERLGLVERIPKRGAVVRLYTPDEVKELNDVRQLLEGHAASLIPLPLRGAPLKHIETLAVAHAEAVRVGDIANVFRLNLAFHQAIFDCSANQVLIDAIRLHAQKSHAYRSILTGDYDYLRWAVRDHGAIVEALRAGDRDLLIELCRGHIRPACNKYISMYLLRYSEVPAQGSST